VKHEFQKIALALSARQIQQFELYRREILAWNDRASLVSKGDECRIVERHFLESAALLHLERIAAAAEILDLGSGAGFPGVPLKILKPELCLTLLDSRRIKTLFLENLIQKLELDRVSVVCERAENLKSHPDFQNKFEVVLSRAVGDLLKVYRWARPFLKPAGVFVAIKGSQLEAELRRFRSNFPSAEIAIENFPTSLDATARNQRIVCLSS
jgi:16S rRNA (guanine527-N7)-methyltransferase